MANAFAQFRGIMTVELGSGAQQAFSQFGSQANRAGQIASSAADRASRSFDGLEGRLRGASATFGSFGGNAGQVASRFRSAAEAVAVFGTAIGGTLAAAAAGAGLIGLTTNIQNYQARLRAASKDNQEFASSFALLQRVANETRSDFGATIGFYTRLKIATEQLGVGQAELGDIITTVQKSIRLSGAGTQEANAALTQFVQGISSANGLSGDEFKSLGENATVVLQSIAKGLKEANVIEGFDGTISALRKLGTEGKLVAETLRPALAAIKDDVDRAFLKLPITIEQATVKLVNNVLVLTATLEQQTGALNGIAVGIGALANNLDLIGVAAAAAGGIFLGRLVPGLLSTAGASLALANSVGGAIRLLGGVGPKAGLATQALTGLRAAGAGLVGLFGGPWGIAIAAAVTGMALLAARTTEVDRAAKTLGTSQDALREEIQKTTDKIFAQNTALEANGRRLGEVARLAAQGATAAANSDLRIGRDSLAGAFARAQRATPGGVDGRQFTALLKQGASIEALAQELSRLADRNPAFARQINAQPGFVDRQFGNKSLRETLTDFEIVRRAAAKSQADQVALINSFDGGNVGIGGAGATAAGGRRGGSRSLAELNAAAAGDETPTQRKTAALAALTAKYKDVAKASAEVQAQYVAERSAILDTFEAEKAAADASKVARKDATAATNEAVEATRRLAEQTAELFRNSSGPAVGSLSFGEGLDSLGKITDQIDTARLKEAGKGIGEGAVERLNDNVALIGQAIGGSIGGAFGRTIQRTTAIAGLLNLAKSGSGDTFSKGFKDQIGDTFRPLTDGFQALFKNNDNISRVLGKLAGSAAIGSVIGKATGGSETGGAIGSTLGNVAGEAIGKKFGATLGKLAAFAGPLGSILGGVLGSLLGGALSKVGVTPRAFANLSTDGSGNATNLGIIARGSDQDKNKGTATQLADSVTGALNKLAATFGDGLQSNFQLGSIGVARGKFEFNTGQFDSKGYAAQRGQQFDTAEAAVEALLRNAIDRGIIKGVKDSTLRLLRATGDFQTQVEKAASFEQVFKDLQRATNPVGAAIDELNRKFGDLKEIFTEAGASATELADLQKLYDLQRAETLKEADSALRDYLDELTTSSSTGLSARDRQGAALAKFAGFESDINAGKKVDGDEFRSAADALLSVNRELFGSQQEYFATLTNITDLTRRAIGNQENVVSIADALRFANQPVTDALNTVNASIEGGFEAMAAALARAGIYGGAANDYGGFSDSYSSFNVRQF